MRKTTFLLSFTVAACSVGCSYDYDSFRNPRDRGVTDGGSDGSSGSGGSDDRTGGSGGLGASGASGGAGAFGGSGGGTNGPGGSGGSTGGSAGAGGTAGGSLGGAGAAGDAGTDVQIVCDGPGAATWPTNGHCYFVLKGQPGDWFTQRDACDAAGAHLVTITSQEEQDFVAQLVGNQDLWIGYAKIEAGAFSWITGEPTDFEYWGPYDPDESGDACAHIRPAGNWADKRCQKPFGALCERK